MKIVVLTRAQALCALLLFTLAVAGAVLFAVTASLPPEQPDAVAVFALAKEASPTPRADHAQDQGSPTTSASEILLSPSVSPTSPPISASEMAVIPTPTPDKSLHVEILAATPAVSAAPLRVLIYHTHTWEAFAQVEEAPYAETEKWRTKDDTANVVRVGEELSALLVSLGCEVTHDATAFEPPELSSSYERSRQMLEGRRARGEAYDLYIDLHRDAYVEGSGVAQTVSVGDLHLARFMLLVGKGTNYAEKPDLAANTALAQRIAEGLDAQLPGLCRGITTKTGRFNQHIAPACVLIECGNNRNTLRQVLDALPYLAQAVVSALAD